MYTFAIYDHDTHTSRTHISHLNLTFAFFIWLNFLTKNNNWTVIDKKMVYKYRTWQSKRTEEQMDMLAENKFDQ